MGNKVKTYSITQSLKFFIPSAIGVFLFMMPVPFNGSYNIPIAIIVSKVTSVIAVYMPIIVYIVIIASAIGTIIRKIIKPELMIKNKLIDTLFNPSMIWTIVRILAAVMVIMLIFDSGPQFIISPNTGRFVVDEFLRNFITTIFFAGSLMTLLLEYGFMDFIGAYLSTVFRKVFTLPGRAAIDCITSWLGDAVVAILITSDQYDKGYYSGREASVIATTFSAVSISFTLVIFNQLKLECSFFSFFYATLSTGMIAAVIMPRIPPLSWKKEDYALKNNAIDETRPEGISLFRHAMNLAIDRAENANYSIVNFFKNGLKTLISCGINTMPIVLFIGTATLALNEYTPLFQWLGYPFLPLLNFLKIPEPIAASGTLLAGFGDNFVPAVIAAATIESQFTRFVIGSLSITQIIYMSQVGALILGSNIPVNFKDLVLIFIERTIISLVIVTLIARYIIF
jgi:nucleoside recognition membrane protein YjiH